MIKFECMWMYISIMDSGGFRIPSSLRIIFSLSLLYFGEYPVGEAIYSCWKQNFVPLESWKALVIIPFLVIIVADG